MSPLAPSADTIRQAQARLARLGHDPSGDPPGELGAHTVVALEAFQRQRGLAITGRLDADTWDRLVEAGWSLGDRLLYVDRPLQRGDDVAALQEALALLGFNPGRIDGIFGTLTEAALADFQRNCALTSTGVLTRETLNELTRLSSRSADRRPVTETHDDAGGARRALVVVHGDGSLARSLVEALAPSVEVIGSTNQSVHDTAALANGENAGLVLAVAEEAGEFGIRLHYFASYRSHSVTGQRLAATVAARAREAGVEIAVSGMSLPILRETMMPALALTLESHSRVDRAVLVEALRVAALGLIDSAR
jgi:N-acetylmuramoyl-L-alanine amidase